MSQSPNDDVGEDEVARLRQRQQPLYHIFAQDLCHMTPSRLESHKEDIIIFVFIIILINLIPKPIRKKFNKKSKEETKIGKIKLQIFGKS